MSDQAGFSRAEAEAADWFAKLRRPAITTKALRDFEAWKRDERNALAFKRVEAGWKATGALASHPDVQAATAKALKRHPEWAVRVTWRTGASVALACGLAAAAGGAYWFSRQLAPSYSTGVGEQRSVVLEDGSRVRLNTDSAVRVWYRGDERRVTLRRGEAFFEVAHDASRPFRVRAGAAGVVALGTRFDVRRETGSVSVVLLQGSVRVDRNGGDARTLLPNQKLVVTGQGVSQPRPADAAETSSWTTGRLTFRGAPLRDAVAEVNRYSKRKIVLAVPDSVAAEPVSGVFDVGDTDAVVAALTMFFDLEASPPDGAVIRLAPRRTPAQS
jgi:transmembrane sensor